MTDDGIYFKQNHDGTVTIVEAPEKAQVSLDMLRMSGGWLGVRGDVLAIATADRVVAYSVTGWQPHPPMLLLLKTADSDPDWKGVQSS